MSLLFPTDGERRRKRDRVLLVFFLIASVLLVERAGRKKLGVLLRNQEWGERFLERVDPYEDPVRGERIHGPYPPSYALVCAPLAALPTPVARRAWGALQVGAIFGTYVLLRRRVRRHWPHLEEHLPAILFLALMLTSRFVLRDTKGGGGNLIYAALALLGLEWSLAKRPALAGLAFAIGLAIKPNLAPLLLFVALRKRWSTLAATAVLTPLVFLAPGLYFGMGDYLALAKRWATDVTAYAELEDLHDSTLVPDGLPPSEHAMNQSLREAVHRVLRPPGDSEAFDVHVVEASPRVAIAIARVASLALLVALGWRAWRARGELDEWLCALAFFPLALLLSPVTWKAHHAALFAYFFVAVAMTRDPRRPRWLVPALWAYWLVCNLLSSDVIGDEASDYLQAISIVTWSDVLLVVAAIARPVPEADASRT